MMKLKKINEIIRQKRQRLDQIRRQNAYKAHMQTYQYGYGI